MRVLVSGSKPTSYATYSPRVHASPLSNAQVADSVIQTLEPFRDAILDVTVHFHEQVHPLDLRASTLVECTLVARLGPAAASQLVVGLGMGLQYETAVERAASDAARAVSRALGHAKGVPLLEVES